MNKDELNELFSRGVATFVDPDDSFKNKVIAKAKGERKEPVVIKLGVDPNRPDIHLGHAVVLRKLRQFQDAGCKVIFLVGGYTARIGDPTGKSKTRPEVELEEIERNAKTYIEQVGKILRTDDPNIFSWISNSDWFTNVTDINLPDDAKVDMEVNTDGKAASVPIPPNSFVAKALVFEQTRMQVRDLGLKDKITVITLSGFLWALRHLTHGRLISRDMFQERLEKGEELYMHEMMYPVLQGIDSSALAQIYGSCDLEIGGTDQTFNMLIGREIMKNNKQEPQAVMALEILTGTDGKEKMSKSLDNYIGITDSPREIFGKVMSVPDSCLIQYFTLATYTPTKEIEKIEERLKEGKLHPKDAKLRLAKEIVAIYHGDKAAAEAETGFIETFSKGGIPDELETVKAPLGERIADIVLSQKLVKSMTEWRRLIKEGAVKNMDSGEAIDSPEAKLESATTLKIGKHRFLKIDTL